MLTNQQRESLISKRIAWERLHFAEPGEVLDAVADGLALIVDIRQRDAFESKGHHPGAVHRHSEEELRTLPKEFALYLYCT